MILNSQNSSLAYWIGAVIVFCSFIFITYESNEEETTEQNISGSAQEYVA